MRWRDAALRLPTLAGGEDAQTGQHPDNVAEQREQHFGHGRDHLAMSLTLDVPEVALLR